MNCSPVVVEVVEQALIFRRRFLPQVYPLRAISGLALRTNSTLRASAAVFMPAQKISTSSFLLLFITKLHRSVFSDPGQFVSTSCDRLIAGQFDDKGAIPQFFYCYGVNFLSTDLRSMYSSQHPLALSSLSFYGLGEFSWRIELLSASYSHSLY